MNTEPLFRALSGNKLLEPDFKKALESVLIQQTLPKNHLLLESAKVADFAWFLLDGFIQSHAYVGGKKTTGDFWKSGQIVVSCNSFFERIPSPETIQLMTQCELLCVSYDNVRKLFAQYPDATDVYRTIMNRYYQNLRNRMIDLQHLTARQRFEKLFITFPDIEQLVPQESIASYIGIEGPSLSRMKRRWKLS